MNYLDIDDIETPVTQCVADCFLSYFILGPVNLKTEQAWKP